MSVTLKHIFSFIILLILLLCVDGNCNQGIWEKFAGVEELKGDWICSVAVDSLGGLLAATYVVSRFDGEKWETFTTEGLPAGYISSIAVGPDGAVWVGTNCGVAQYNDGGFITLPDGYGLPVTEDNPSAQSVLALIVDNDNVLWVGTGGGGISKYNEDKWTVFDLGPMGNIVNTFCVDANSVVWAGTSGGIFYYDGEVWKAIHTPIVMTNRSAHSMIVFPDGKMCVGTDHGVFYYNGLYWQQYTKSDGALPHNNVRSMAIDTQGRIWVGTSWGGVSRFDGTNWEIMVSMNGTMDDSHVNSIVVDPDGVVWFATSGGLYRYQETVGVKYIDTKTFSVKIDGNFPNPFNPRTQIRFSLPYAKIINLEIYNVLGQKVRTLIDGEMNTGIYRIIWDGKNDLGQDAASGVYFVRLNAGSVLKTRPMLLLR